VVLDADGTGFYSFAACAAKLGVPLRCVLQVSEQTDSLRVLGSDPVDYLITPRVMACMIAAPILNLACFCMGERVLELWRGCHLDSVRVYKPC
jgi:hypothetical protein